MELDREWVLFLLVELSSECSREHFVDSNVRQEHIELLKQLSFVFELFKLLHQFLITDNLCQTRNFYIVEQIFNLSLWVFNDQTDSVVFLVIVDGVRELYLKWLWRRLLRHLRHRNSCYNRLIFISQQILIRFVVLLVILLDRFHCLSYLILTDL